ncbi:MAG: hypothetical protein K0S29_779 [Gammaproteobacteria bacterium]|jgi:hypothetical protein|nr:hypothetical protein [Gammaproteobacteria bacterium]
MRYLLLVTLFFLPLQFSYALDQNITAQGRVITPISISFPSGNTVNFGIINAGSSNSAVRVNGAVRSLISGDAQLITGGTISGLGFSISGQTGQAASVQITPSTLSGPGSAMSIVIGSYTPTCTLNCNYQIPVDLQIPAGQTPGSYSGTITITANYQ